MNAWTWFAVPPVTLLAAYFALGPVSTGAARPLPPLPAIESLKLPPSLTITAANSSYQRGGPPKEIRFSAFGVREQQPTGRHPRLAESSLKARDRLSLQSVLLTSKLATATIDNQVVVVGSRLPNGFKVAQINAGNVLLSGPSGLQRIDFPAYRDPAPLRALAAPVKVESPRAAPGEPVSATPSEFKQLLEMLKL